eukprot:jgi/Chrzof1/10882/Cz05g15250.t1
MLLTQRIHHAEKHACNVIHQRELRRKPTQPIPECTQICKAEYDVAAAPKKPDITREETKKLQKQQRVPTSCALPNQ